jgi:hypothetical protein
MTATPQPFRAGRTVDPAEVAASPAFSGTYTLLADVSEFQPNVADATYLKWSRGIIIRALYGTTTDAAWYGGQRRADLHAGGAKFVGIYAYLVTSESAEAQAQAFRALVGDPRPGEVFIPDIEQGDHALLTAWYNAMLSLYGPAIDPYLWPYTGEDFGESIGILPVEWIAAYQANEPSSPHKLWQFTDAYDIPGVGVADCSVFHGSIDELAALAYQTPAPAPKPPAAWTYGAPGRLEVTPGHTDFHASWSEPADSPDTPAFYRLWVYKGSMCTSKTLVDTYPWTQEDGTETSPDPGGLEPGTLYTLHVAAFGPGGTRSRADVFVSAQFITGK